MPNSQDAKETNERALEQVMRGLVRPTEEYPEDERYAACFHDCGRRTGHSEVTFHANGRGDQYEWIFTANGKRIALTERLSQSPFAIIPRIAAKILSEAGRADAQ